jgi:manganese/zinc/iron transport system permease protein
MNPYFGKNFFQFIGLFFQRVGDLLIGKLSIADLASDEIQVFVLSLVACASALVGSFLVLKRMTMLANSLSHTILLGIVVAYLILLPFHPEHHAHAHILSIKALLLAALLTGLITTLLTQMLTQLIRLQEDASTGLVFTTLFALGIVLVTVFTRNAHLGTEAIMGNIDALHGNDLKLMFWITLFDLILVVLLFKEFKITTFDGSLASAQGFSPSFFNYLLMTMTSATVIGAFRAVGVLLVLAFLVGPVLSARLLTHRLKWLILVAICIGIFTSLISVALSRHLLSVYHTPLSTAGLATTVIGAVYFGLLLIKAGYKLARKQISEKIV